MKFGWDKCAKVCLKSGVHRKQHIGNTTEIEIKELD
jgi:hypothetical protein